MPTPNDNPYRAPLGESLPDLSVETPNQRRCHQCGGEEFSEWTPLHPLILHWQLNPGLAFNELVLGQRIPSHMFICKGCGSWAKPESQYFECPSCERFHAARVWRSCPFGNWMGLVCPDCGEFIPCVTNLWSRLIQVMLCPILFPLKILVKPRYQRWAQGRVIASRAIFYRHSQTASQMASPKP